MATEENFYGLGIVPGILEILERLNFKVPTPIQSKSIPIGVQGKDVMGIAQTGTGKTIAFGVPLIQAVIQGRGRGLVVLPTRELALQVHEVFRKIGGPLRVTATVLIGGESIGRQIRELQRNPDILIGTPGRIIDHLNQRTLNLARVKILVLDEADRMLDMGFAPQLARILENVPKERQTMLFSATMPQQIMKIAHSYMKLPVRVEIAPPGTALEQVTQELFIVPKDAKLRLLEKLLAEYHGSILVFIRTKFGVKKITHMVRLLGHTVSEIHSNRSLSQRREALDGFRSGRYRVLIATDIASRGIDVKGIEVVINFDLPANPEDYIHRIGRTGRAGMTGRAIAFATPDQRRDVMDIERLMRIALPPSKLPELPPARVVPFIQPEQRGFSPRRFGNQSSRSAPSQNNFYGQSAGQGSRPPFRGPRRRPFGGSDRRSGGRDRGFGPRR